ncbi:MAG: 30S ribosomal protein S17 [Chloroflexi bacterium]|nr:30S ribosomal protein S17 [Chloroflexota bacterium]
MAGTNRPEQIGRVASTKMQKTVVVEIDIVKQHPLYRRPIRRTARLKAHDETNACRVGDIVRLEPTRPLSKEKRWRVAEVLEQEKGLAPID